MKAILLAAGRGSRLHPLTELLPKPLVTIGKKTCLDIALESLSAVADSIIVVTGYLGDKINAHLDLHPLKVPVQVVVNPNPRQGNLTSLAAARSLVAGDGFIVTNADHLFPPNFYTHHFLESDGINIAAQNNRPVLDDEMKVVIVSQQLQKISKSLRTFDGAYIGATRIPKNHSSTYWAAFDQVKATINPARACVEDVLYALAESEKNPEVTWVNEARWFEVDTLEDLEVARRELT